MERTRLFPLLLVAMAAVVLSAALEVRIHAYPRPKTDKTESVVTRIGGPSKPGQRRVVQTYRTRPIIRIQPTLLQPTILRPVSLVDTLHSMGFRTMATALETAHLEQYLKEAGTITLFAPTDESLQLMSLPQQEDRLRRFLLQHVIQGRLLPENVRNDVTVPTLSPDAVPLRLNLYENGQMVLVSGAQFLDGARDYGSIHIQPIDNVLFPLSKENLVNQARLTFPRLYEYLMNASVWQQLSSGTFTLFAPDDDAFDILPPDVLQRLSDDPSFLRKVLLHHVVPGTYYSAVLSPGYELKTMSGWPIYFTNRRSHILANGIPLVNTDFSVSNGVIHAINRVLLPPEYTVTRKYVTVSAPPETTTHSGTTSMDTYTPVTAYMEPPPPVPRTITKAMFIPLKLPDGRNLTFSTGHSLFRRSLLLTGISNNEAVKNFTIIMPTDGAYDALGHGTLDRLRRDSRLLRKMLHCQMIEGHLDLFHRGQKDAPVHTLGGPVVFSTFNGGRVKFSILA